MISITKKTNSKGKEDAYYVNVNDEPSFGFSLTGKQLEEFYIEAVRWLFDNLLEQNKDILMRLKNNEPAPQKLDTDKVIEWFDHNICTFKDYDGDEITIETLARQFKEDFDL